MEYYTHLTEKDKQKAWSRNRKGRRTGTESTAVESQGTEETKAPETAGEAAEKNAEAVVITAWHDNDEAMMNALADVVNEELKDDNITLKFEKNFFKIN